MGSLGRAESTAAMGSAEHMGPRETMEPLGPKKTITSPRGRQSPLGRRTHYEVEEAAALGVCWR